MRSLVLIAGLLTLLVIILPANGATGTSTHMNPEQLERAFLCIHKYEGAWNANTGNGYYGGLQMDRTFQRTYGPEFYRAWGTANNWPPHVQLTVAYRAYFSGRGFHPWPNTARRCGLL